MDGEQLIDKLKALGLGIKMEMVQRVDIDQDWFKNS
jgi:restriction system protein